LSHRNLSNQPVLIGFQARRSGDESVLFAEILKSVFRRAKLLTRFLQSTFSKLTLHRCLRLPAAKIESIELIENVERNISHERRLRTGDGERNDTRFCGRLGLHAIS